MTYERKRVAVTGYGVVTPAAVGVSAFEAALRSGTRSISRLEGVPVPRGKDAVGRVTGLDDSSPDWALRLARRATEEALSMAGPAPGEGTALILSTIAGDSGAAESHFHRLAALDNGASADSNLREVLKRFSNGALCDSLARCFDVGGPRLVVTNACASGNIALGLGLDLIRFGRIRRALVVGVEIAKLTMVWGAERSGFIGRDIRPFHRERDGSLLGDGAAAVVLDEEESADPDRVEGWLEGFGCVCDRGAAPITLLEDGSGLRRSMELALEDGRRRSREVQYVNAHAPGTPKIDLIECRAISDLCGDHTGQVAVNATKGITTHLSGASALAELTASLLQMDGAFLHPNVGLDEPDPALPLHPVGPRAVEKSVTRALSNACGGGGLNTSVLVVAAKEPPARAADRRDLPEEEIAITGLGSISTAGAITGPLSARCSLPPGRLSDFDVTTWFDEETNFEYMNRAAQIAVVAAHLALADRGLTSGPDGEYASDRLAVVAGTWLGGSPEASRVLCQVLEENPDSMRPSMSLDHGMHLGAALICRHYDFTGATYTLTGFGSAGLMAVGLLADLLRSGRADAGIGVGYDSLDDMTELGLSLAGQCGVVKAVASEGGGAVVLERAGEAQARGRQVHALLGPLTSLGVDLDRRRGLDRAADRLAAALDPYEPERLYLGSPPTPRLEHLGRELYRRLGCRGGLQIAHSPRSYLFGAEGLRYLSQAAGSRERAVVLSLDPGGAAAALPVLPPAAGGS